MFRIYFVSVCSLGIIISHILHEIQKGTISNNPPDNLRYVLLLRNVNKNSFKTVVKSKLTFGTYSSSQLINKLIIIYFSMETVNMSGAF